MSDRKPSIDTPIAPLNMGSSGGTQAKLAQRIANEIESRIVVEGWAAGYPLGTEATWAQELQVSRWIVREALALLEQKGVVESRRGRYGGVFVAASLGEAACNSLSTYLEFIRVSAADLRAVRGGLQRTVIELALERTNDASRERLRDLVQGALQPLGPASLEAAAAIRKTLLTATGNPALELFLSALSQGLLHAFWYSSLDDEAFRLTVEAMVRSTCRVAESVIQGRSTIALDAEDEFIRQFEHVYSASALSARRVDIAGATDRADRMFPIGRPVKKPELIARRIRQDIFESGAEVGTNLGMESDLMTRYDVGRAVLREAVRSLERLGVVKMGRGSNSGLHLIAPDPVEVVTACRRHLRRAGTLPQHAKIVREALTGVQADRPAGDNIVSASSNPLAELFLLIIREFQ